MKIKEILNQHRRDFTAIFVCGHCKEEVERDGYDDRNFHDNIIPAMKCKSCGKAGEDNYTALATKYLEGVQV